MKKLYYIQFTGEDLVLQNKIKSLGRIFQLDNGWVVESIIDAKEIYEFISESSLIDIVILGLDKKNFFILY